MIEETLSEVLLDLACSESYEADFKYIKPKQGLMSELVKGL